MRKKKKEKKINKHRKLERSADDGGRPSASLGGADPGTCSVDGHAMIWRSSPLYSSCNRACSLWKTCWMLFCEQSREKGNGGKKADLLASAGGKINKTFPSAAPTHPPTPLRYLVSMSTIWEVLIFFSFLVGTRVWAVESTP